jgi:ketosteroid isomerase-like protein
MNPEQELLHTASQWDEAMINNNAEEIGRFMSEDWVIVGTEGGITSKQDFLQTIMSGDLEHHTMNADETRTRIYGDMAVFTSRGTSAGNYKGMPFEFYEWQTSIFIREQGKWLCVHTMLTPALKNQ